MSQRTEPSNRPIVALVAIVAILSIALAYVLVTQAQQAIALCAFQQRSYLIQHEQIIDDKTPQKPSEAVLRAFPQLRPFYDPHNPLYAEQIRALDAHARRKLHILGSPPDC